MITTAHVSIDDCMHIWSDLINHQDVYNSIFQNEFLGYLLRLHTEYGLKITLYSFFELGSCSIDMLSDIFKNEFVNNSNWLRIGFHWPSIKEGKDVACESILTYFDRFQSAVLNFAGSSFLSDTLRLHFFYGTDIILNYLNKKGIKSFLTADDNRASYNLSKKEYAIMHRIGVFHKHGIQYRPSTARLERFSSQEICKKIATVHDVVLFTHECFLLKQTIRGYIKDFVIKRKIEPNKYNRYKFEKTIRWLYNNNYKFIL